MPLGEDQRLWDQTHVERAVHGLLEAWREWFFAGKHTLTRVGQCVVTVTGKVSTVWSGLKHRTFHLLNIPGATFPPPFADSARVLQFPSYLVPRVGTMQGTHFLHCSAPLKCRYTERISLNVEKNFSLNTSLCLLHSFGCREARNCMLQHRSSL